MQGQLEFTAPDLRGIEQKLALQVADIQRVVFADHTLTLRDAFPDPVSDDNCDTVGVFAPLLGIVGSQMASAALKLLIGLPVPRGLLTLIDALEGTTRAVKLRRS